MRSMPSKQLNLTNWAFAVIAVVILSMPSTLVGVICLNKMLVGSLHNLIWSLKTHITQRKANHLRVFQDSRTSAHS